MIDYRQLTLLPDEELGRFDLAVVNLACAAGLPGADGVNTTDCLQRLDSWAATVRRWTDAALQEHLRPRATLQEEAEFRLIALHTALHRHCGVRYHPAKVGAAEDAPFDLDDMCIAAVTSGRGGTCATLPVVYTAVGRRLGYPLRLGLAKAHVFCRWDDPGGGVRANLDGGSSPMIRTEDYYRLWPFPMAVGEEEQFGYLRPLPPRQELALFVASRGWVWESVGEFSRAVAEFAAAADLDDPWPRYPSCIRRTVRAWSERIASTGGGRPQAPAASPTGQRRWPGMPWALEAEIGRLEAEERATEKPPREASWDGSQARRTLGW